MIKKPSDLTEKEYVNPGTRACAGCGLALAYRHALKALGDKTILAIPASCLTVLEGIYPQTAVSLSCINSPFPAAAATASGIKAALKAKGKDDFVVAAFAGDGGTYDIGIQALSGAAERQSDFIYTCYDNEAYMNTGTQRSSATPPGVLTTTTPVLTKLQPKKDFLSIMEAHHLPYIATTSPSYPLDLFNKYKKAREIKGMRFIHIAVPCPPGWGYPTQDTVEIGKLAIICGITVLYEIIDGRLFLTGKSKKIAKSGKLKPIDDYIKAQSRFKSISSEQIKAIQEIVDKRWHDITNRAEAP